jgi:hypothetical protein
LEDSLEERKKNGYIVVEIESSEFDREVMLVMQPPEKFYDFNYRNLGEMKDPRKHTTLFLSS